MSKNRSVEDFILDLQNQIGDPARLEAVLTYDHPGWALTPRSRAQRYPGDGNRLARRASAKGRPR